jgi:tRNA 2-thiouridine synthesizing protein A
VSEYEVDKEIDLSGLVCPVPLVNLGREIATLPIGGVLRAITTDPACVSDVMAWAKTQGHELLETQHSGSEYAFLIRRTH